MDRSIRNIVDNADNFVKNPGHDFIRKRKIGMDETIKLVLTMQGGTLNQELFKHPRLSGIKLTPSAFVQQRSKLLPSAFEALFHEFNNACQDKITFQGYRVFAVDGSDLNIPRDPNANTFIKSTERFPRGYNQYHINALFDLCNKVYTDCVIQIPSKSDERDALISFLKHTTTDDKKLFITDRGYESYNVFANYLETENTDFLCRVKHGVGCMAEIKTLPMIELDRDISTTVTTTQTKNDKQNGYHFIQTGSKKGKINSDKTKISKWDFESPYTLNLRVVRIMLDTGEYETLVTSLDRKLFPSNVIKELYHMRWGIETSFRELKYNIGLVNLHAKKAELIQQEIYAGLTMYNFCERITNAVVVLQKEENAYEYQVNYTMAFYICRKYYTQPVTPAMNIIKEIGRYILPIRPGRRDKRNLKAKSVVSFLYRVAA